MCVTLSKSLKGQVSPILAYLESKEVGPDSLKILFSSIVMVLLFIEECFFLKKWKMCQLEEEVGWGAGSGGRKMDQRAFSLSSKPASLLSPHPAFVML